MPFETLTVETSGEGFYSITDRIKPAIKSGVLHLFVPHTSCALTISEDFDKTAKEDMETFLKELAPRNLAFIKHTLEGPDDSPSHMKSILLQPHLTIFVEEGSLVLGKWQGIFLAEFRDGPMNRKIYLLENGGR